MINIRQSIRYSMVSGICLVLGMTLIPLFSAAGLHYSLATIVAFCVVTMIGFCLHCYWTFSVERSLPSFFRYASAMALNLPLAIVLIGLAHDLAGVSVLISTGIASAILLAWNYLSVKWAVLRQPLSKTQ